MRVEAAVLCDAASIREGLLHILGGGITGTTVASFPASLPVTFAFRAVLDSREASGADHVLRVTLKEAIDEHQIGFASVTFIRNPEAETSSEEALVFPMPLDTMEVPRAGLYLLQAALDQRNVVTIPFRVDLQSAIAEPAAS